MTNSRVRETIGLAASIVAVIGAPLAGGIWLGSYAKEIEILKVQRCEFELLHKVTYVRGQALNEYLDFVNGRLNVLSLKLNYEKVSEKNTAERNRLKGEIMRFEKTRDKSKEKAEKLIADGERLEEQVKSCSDS